MKDTKKRILKGALAVFNEKGYANTRLQDIAEHLGMSVGNLAYHYRNQLEMLEAIFIHFQDRHTFMVGELGKAPIFENLDEFLSQFFKLQQEYLFFFIDMLEIIRSSDEVSRRYQEQIRQLDLLLELILEMNKARGALTWSAASSVADLAILWRRNLNAWPSQRMIEKKQTNDFQAFRNSSWAVIMPYFTDVAIEEYQNLASFPGKKPLFSRN